MSILQDKLPIDHRDPASLTTEARARAVPVHLSMTHSSFIRPDRFPALVAILNKRYSLIILILKGILIIIDVYFSVFLLIAIQAMRLSLDGSVLLSGQWGITQEAAEMVRVPTGFLRTRVLGSKDQL